MKIGIVTNLYPPYVRGGAEHVVVRTVEELIEQGEDVFVVTTCPKWRADDLECYRNASERIYHFFPKNFYHVLDDFKFRWPTRLMWHIRDAFHLQSARLVGEAMDREQPDVMMTHNLKGIGLLIPAMIHRKNIPYVHVVHDLQLIIPSGLRFVGSEKPMLALRPVLAMYRFMCRMLFANPDVVIFPSVYLKTEYEKYGFFKKSRIEVLHNPAPSVPTVDRRVRNKGPLQLLFVGQLEDHKGIRFLLDATKHLNVPAVLNIAGEGRLKPLVMRYAENDKKINYLGYIAIEQLTSCFGITDALVVPSLCYENSPTVIYEALQAGVPVLASNIGGVGELVDNGKNGFLFRAGDREDFYRVVRELDVNKDALAAAQNEIRETVAPYALPTYARKLRELLVALIADIQKQ